MASRPLFLKYVLFLILGGLFSQPALGEITTLAEDFSTWEYRDEALTTAHWDTLAGQLQLFPVGLDSLGFIHTAGGALASFVDGDNLYAADSNNRLFSIDISDPTSPVELDQLTTLSGARDVTVADNYAFVTVGGSGVQSVNLADPSDLVEGGHLDLVQFAYGLVHRNGRLYIAQASSGVAVVDVSSPWNPTHTIDVATNDWARDVALRGNELLVADSDQGLTIMDISSPDQPQIISDFNTENLCWAVSAWQDRAYLACGSGGMVIVDIADPQEPTAMGNLVFPGLANCRNVTAVGDTVYAAVNDIGLYVVDVSDPVLPQIVASYNTPGNAYHVSVDGTDIWVADGTGGMRSFELNPLALDEDANVGQSLNLTQAGEPVNRARLAAVTTDSIRFELTVDGGQSWSEIWPDDQWLDFAEPGEDFRWRTTLVMAGEDIAPTVSQISLTYEKLHGYGEVSAVSDVPGDGGGQVRVAWSPSRFDVPDGEFEVTEYSIYRRYQATEGSAEITSLTEPRLAEPELAYPPGLWDFVTTVPADMEDQYAAVVPTLADSTYTEGMAWSVYFVRTRTSTTGTFFDSPPDSGYSLNNLQPAPPTGFVVHRDPGDGTQLSWDPPAIPDFAHFRVYRTDNQNIPPQPATLFQVTTDSELFDDSEGFWFYQLTVVNLAGHESEAASRPWSSVLPAANQLTLRQNTPNPFNPLTRIDFEVPQGGAHMQLAVYDARGLRIRELVDEFLPQGPAHRLWNGRDHQGRKVSSGVYYARLESAGQQAVIKMVMVR